MEKGNGEKMPTKKKQQVTRGHNIVADGWAGAANPHAHLTPRPTQPPSQHRHIEKKVLKHSFSHFLTRVYERTDQQTEGRTNPPLELRVRN